MGMGTRSEHLSVVYIALFFQIMYRELCLEIYLNKKRLRNIQLFIFCPCDPDVLEISL